jgi:hypothetical protein
MKRKKRPKPPMLDIPFCGSGGGASFFKKQPSGASVDVLTTAALLQP